MKRAATRVGELAIDTGLEDWVAMHRRRKLNFAGEVARVDDGRWANKVLQWRPVSFKRDLGRPKTRWMDQLERFTGGDWMQMAMDEDRWAFLGECFAVADLV